MKPHPNEIDSIYVEKTNRFIVSFIVGYDQEGGVTDPRDAAVHALSLVTEGDTGETVWHVFDRIENTSHDFPQAELANEIIPTPRTRVVFEAIGPADTNEGRGPGICSYGFFETRNDAEEAAKDKGVMGTPGSVRPRVAVRVDPSTDWIVEGDKTVMVTQENVEERKKRALAKLTAEERELLGLD